METERQEVYERIPWETLERQGGDRQWLVIAISGAVAVGALAFSFMRGQPVAPALQEPAGAEVAAAVVPTSVPPAPVTAVQGPMLVAEADLYAIDPERLIDIVAGHAEWFAVEFFSIDGSDQSRATISGLLPQGIPAPEAPPGTQVFVDWVGVRSVAEVAPLTYEVEVLVRSLASHDDGAFERQPARSAIIEVLIGTDGVARVTSAPTVTALSPPTPQPGGLAVVPAHIVAQVAGLGDPIGGEQLADGRWKVVVMVTGPDGVRRPETFVSS